MNCQEFWERYPELSPPSDRQHAAECPDCARLLANQDAIGRGLQLLAAELKEIEAPARVESGLVSALRAQHAFRERPTRLWVPVLSWAAAAVVLVVLAMFVIRGREPQVAPRRVPARSVELASLQTPLDLTWDGDASDGEFIPIPDAAQIDPGDDVNVVRVAVPRTAMLALGLSVAPERASEMVEADVMLGSDGMARAVRFINE